MRETTILANILSLEEVIIYLSIVVACFLFSIEIYINVDNILPKPLGMKFYNLVL